MKFLRVAVADVRIAHTLPRQFSDKLLDVT